MSIDPKTTMDGSTEPLVVTPAARPAVNHMDARLIDSIAWTAVAKWLTQLVSWASLLIVARLLMPADFGVLGLVFLKRPGFAWPQLKSLRRALSFSGAVLVANVCWYAYSNADFTIAGRVLGKATLGIYTLAWTLANAPGEKITTLIMRVT